MIKKDISLFFFLLILSGCKEDEKILQVLKEINHRHDHQYAMQLLLKKYDIELNEALTVEEKREVLEYRKWNRDQDISSLKRSIRKELYEIKKINNKNFTGKILTNLHAYASKQEEDYSFVKAFCVKLPLYWLTSSKHDSDIALFLWHVDRIIDIRIQLLELEYFPDYCNPRVKNLIRETSPSIEHIKKVNENTIDSLIEKYSH